MNETPRARETTPKAVEWIPARVDGAAGHRLMVIFAAPGCSYAFSSGGCTNCSFPQSFGVRHPVGAAEYLAQLEAAWAQVPPEDPGPIQLDLFVSGSFFNRTEVPPEAQTALLTRGAADRRVGRITVETRPEFATREVLDRAEAALAGTGVALEVAIGLESAQAHVREERIRKGFTWEQFEQGAAEVAGLARRLACSLRVYLLLKPLDTGEAEAIEDLVQSAERVFALGRRLDLETHVGLEPCFVGPDTVLEQAFDQGRYRPPWLWSVIEVVRRIAPLGPVHVGLSDEGLNPKRSAHNCPACERAVRAALARFNQTADPAPLAALDCACRSTWRTALEAGTEPGKAGI